MLNKKSSVNNESFRGSQTSGALLTPKKLTEMKKGRVNVNVPKKLLQGEKLNHNSCEEFNLPENVVIGEKNP